MRNFLGAFAGLSRNKKRLVKTVIGAAAYLFAVLYKPGSDILSLVFYLAAFAVIGGDIVLKALRNIARGKVFDENFLMSIAAIGAFAIGDYAEGTAVMLFYQVGELFQSYAVDKSRKSIAELMDIRPDYANVLRGDTPEKVDPEAVEIGETIVIRPGEKVPLDAVVLEGSSMLDTAALTGESLPRAVAAGDSLLSGCINVNGLLTARVTKTFGESTVSKILDLVENAVGKKSGSENFITKFARWYTPAVVIAAALLAIVPPVALHAAFSDWLYRALVFLVISCPCALVISIPLSFFGGIGGASRRGILVKGSNYLEALSRTEIVVFDKTGTLTEGTFTVRKISPVGISGDALLETAACAESYSNHPISVSLRRAYGREISRTRVSGAEEIAGYGVTAVVDGHQAAVGNAGLMRMKGITCEDTAEVIGTVVHVAMDGAYKGYIVIADQIKEDAPRAIRGLKELGINRTVMLTGDTERIASDIAARVGIDSVYAQLLPADKVMKVEALLPEKSENGKLVFVGDGINDAPVLARADVGVAMGGLGSDAAIEAADVVIMTDEPSKLAEAVKISKKTLRIVKENIALALGVKGVILALGAAGLASMWAAVFADVGVALIAILNAIRMLRVRYPESRTSVRQDESSAENP